MLQFRDGTHVDLYFSQGAVQTSSVMAKAHNSRFDIRYSRADYQQAVELVWHHQGTGCQILEQRRTKQPPRHCL